MSEPLLLTLRFREPRQDVHLPDLMQVFEDLEACYLAAPRAMSEEVRFGAALLAERDALRSPRGLDQEALAELEYATRALRRLQREGAPEEVLQAMHESVFLLGRRQVDGLYGSRSTRSLPGVPRQVVRRMSMRSPLEIVTSIPAEYWTGGGLLLFIAAIEKHFNFIDRIRTERVDLSATRAERRADEREAEVRQGQAEQVLSELRNRRQIETDYALQDLPRGGAPLELEAGELAVEDPQSPGRALGQRVERPDEFN